MRWPEWKLIIRVIIISVFTDKEAKYHNHNFSWDSKDKTGDFDLNTQASSKLAVFLEILDTHSQDLNMQFVPKCEHSETLFRRHIIGILNQNLNSVSSPAIRMSRSLQTLRGVLKVPI